MNESADRDDLIRQSQQLAVPQLALEQAQPNADNGFLRPAAGESSLASALAARKKAAAAIRKPEVEGPAPEVGKAGSRNKFLDGLTDVMDWGGKGLGYVKDTKDTTGLYGKDLPDLVNAVGDGVGLTRDAADSALQAYAPIQEGLQSASKFAKEANTALNPIPKISLGRIGDENIALNVGTKDVLDTASGMIKIAQYHKNEGADPNATAIDERKAVSAGQDEFRRALEGRRRVGRLLDTVTSEVTTANGGTRMDDDVADSLRVKQLLAKEKSRANLVTMQKGMRLALRAGELGKAQEKVGIRPNNEYSMEQTAYLNDKEFVPRKPLGFFDDENADKWSPKKGVLGDKATVKDIQGATAKAHSKYAGKGAEAGQPLPEGLVPDMKDSAKLEQLPDDYRDDIEGGRSKQKQVAIARFGKGAGELLEGKLNTDRMVRDGRYKTAYAAKAAQLGVLTGTKAGAGAAQAGLMLGTGGIAAPFIAAAEAGKHLAFHAKEQVGMGLQSASEGLEKLIDPEGKAKEQDNRDLYNKHFGLAKPEAVAPEGDDKVADEEKDANSSAEIVNPQPDVPLADGEELKEAPPKDPLMEGQVPAAEQPAAGEVPASDANDAESNAADPSARAADIRARGIHWEKQGDRSVVGRQKRTLARAGKDVLWGGTKKVLGGLWGGIKSLGTLPLSIAKWGWKGIKGIGSLFGRKKKVAENPARAALKQLQEQSKMSDIDRPQFNFASLKQDDITMLSKEEQDQLRLQRDKYEGVFGKKAHARAPRVGGTREAAKAALAAKPEVKRAEELAALREQLAPGKYTPRMQSGEILDMLRGRARQEITEEKAAAVAPPVQQNAAPQQNADPPRRYVRRGRAHQRPAQVAVNPLDAPVNAPASQGNQAPPVQQDVPAPRDDAADGGGGNDLLDQIQSLEQDGVKSENRLAGSADSYQRRVDSWQARASAAGMGLIMNPDDPWMQANPFPQAGKRPRDLSDHPLVEGDKQAVNVPESDRDEVGERGSDAGTVMERLGSLDLDDERLKGGEPPQMQQLIDGQWQMAPEEEKGVGVPQSAPKAVPQRAAGSRVPKPTATTDYLDTSAMGVTRAQRLMDPRELALLTNSANPERTRKQLPAIQEAVAKAQGAETKDDATSAWHTVAQLQRGVVNRRWSGYRPSDEGALRAADERIERRRDLLRGQRLDVSTAHEGLDLPSAFRADRRLMAGGDDQFRIGGFGMPGDAFSMFQNPRAEVADLAADVLRNPGEYEMGKGDDGGGADLPDRLLKAYGSDERMRGVIQQTFLQRERTRQQGIDFGAKRALGDDNMPTADAQAQAGPITVDDRPVYPQVPNLDADANAEAGGVWRMQDTDQAVQRAGVFGAGGRQGAFGPTNEGNQFGEFHRDPIAKDAVLEAPAAGWDAQPKKPGWFPGDKAKEAYREAEAKRAKVVSDAYQAMRKDRMPGYIAKSNFGRQEWTRLDRDRKAREDQKRMALQMRIHQNQLGVGPALFGVMPADRKRR